jgi:hypothetical protein
MTNKEKKVFILAGEASGDYIGSSVMKGLKLIDEKNNLFWYWRSFDDRRRD